MSQEPNVNDLDVAYAAAMGLDLQEIGLVPDTEAGRPAAPSGTGATAATSEEGAEEEGAEDDGSSSESSMASSDESDEEAESETESEEEEEGMKEGGAAPKVAPAAAGPGPTDPASLPRETEPDSSPEASSSSAATSSDEDSDSDGDINFPEGGDVWRAVDQMYADEDDEDGGAGAGAKGPPRTKNEVAELPPPAEIKECVAESDEILPLGTVTAVVGQSFVVTAGPGTRPVDEGTVVCLGDRRIVGKIEEVFGPVLLPFYSFRYAGPQPQPSELASGVQLFSVKRLAEFLVEDHLRTKGYDASGQHDEEVEEIEFSDDEKEQEHRRSLKKNKRKGNPGEAGGPVQEGPGGRGRGRGREGRGREGGGRGAGRGGGRGGGRFTGPVAQQYVRHETSAAQQQLLGMAVGGPRPPPGPPPPGQAQGGQGQGAMMMQGGGMMMAPGGYYGVAPGGYGGYPTPFPPGHPFGGNPMMGGYPMGYMGYPMQPGMMPMGMGMMYGGHPPPPQQQQQQQQYGQPHGAGQAGPQPPPGQPPGAGGGAPRG